jgi:hypothetical protein
MKLTGVGNTPAVRRYKNEGMKREDIRSAGLLTYETEWRTLRR